MRAGSGLKGQEQGLKDEGGSSLQAVSGAQALRLHVAGVDEKAGSWTAAGPEGAAPERRALQGGAVETAAREGDAVKPCCGSRAPGERPRVTVSGLRTAGLARGPGPPLTRSLQLAAGVRAQQARALPVPWQGGQGIRLSDKGNSPGHHQANCHKCYGRQMLDYCLVSW